MQAPHLGFYARWNRFLRRVMLTIVLLLVGSLAAWLAAQNRVGDEIRREVERRFASHYPGYRVAVRAARLVEGRGIEIQGLSIIRRPEIEPMVSIDEIFVTCAVSMEDLIRGRQPQAERVLLRGVTVRARQDAQGDWDLGHLWPPPTFSARAPEVLVRQGRLRLISGEGDARRTWGLRDLRLDLSPQGMPMAPDWRVRGRSAGDHFDSLEFEAFVPGGGGDWSATGVLAGLRLSSRCYESLPEPWRGQSVQLAPLSGLATLDFQVTGDPLAEQSWQVAVGGSLTQGQIVDRRLPYRLYDAEASFGWDGQRLSVKHFFARNGATEVEGALEWDGFAADSPLRLQASARRLALDRRFIEFLPERFRGDWRKFFPTGQVDAQVQLAFDGQQWHPEVRVECNDVSFVYHRFPYRLERAHGELLLKEDVLSIDLQAMAGGQRVTINGLIRQPGEAATGWIDIACPRPIPLDDKLLDAVAVSDPTARSVVRALNPGGTLAVTGRFEWTGPGEESRHWARIDLHNCTMRYDGFPYPFAMINGTLLWDNDGWRFENLSGRNDSGYIECEGSWTPADDGGSLLLLNFVAVDVPLEDQLRQALNPAAQQVWRSLQPHGSIDHLNIVLRYASAQRDLSLQIKAQKWKKRPHDEGRGISLRPTWFPYRLDDVTGVVVYRDGDIHLQGISARHDQTVIHLDGHCRTQPDGQWTVELANVVADRVRFDQDLLEALPEGLARAIGRLDLRGNLGMQGAVALRGVDGASPTRAWWDLAVDVEGGSLNCGVQLDNLHGDVRLVGQSQGTTYSSRGELNIDSLVYQDLQLTGLRGPLLIEPDRVLIGAEAERDLVGTAPRSLAAQAIGGQLTVDAVVHFGGDVPFALRAGLERGELAQLARDLALKNQNIRGQANALVNLSGTGQGRHTWHGDGLVRLYEADIYEVPVMLALLKLLSIRQPDRTAFTSGDIDFRIQGEHLYFDRINFNGDAISLKGHGDMSLDRHINLRFYTLVGRRDWDPPVLRALLQQAAQQILLIHASGTLDQPHLTREPLPMLKDTLDQLFPEVAAPNHHTRRPSLILR